MHSVGIISALGITLKGAIKDIEEVTMGNVAENRPGNGSRNPRRVMTKGSNGTLQRTG
jgi:hypothetical protein